MIEVMLFDLLNGDGTHIIHSCNFIEEAFIVAQEEVTRGGRSMVAIIRQNGRYIYRIAYRSGRIKAEYVSPEWFDRYECYIRKDGVIRMRELRRVLERSYRFEDEKGRQVDMRV